MSVTTRALDTANDPWDLAGEISTRETGDLIKALRDAHAAHVRDMRIASTVLIRAARQHSLCERYDEVIDLVNNKLVVPLFDRREWTPPADAVREVRLTYTVSIDATITGDIELFTDEELVSKAYNNLDERGFLSDPDNHSRVECDSGDVVTFNLEHYAYDRAASVALPQPF